MPTTTSINFSSTTLPGAFAPTPSTFSTFSTDTSTAGDRTSVGAILTESDTTVTAFQVPSTTGLLVVDGTTLTWRHDGITLSDGDVISAGFDGLQDASTTALLSPILITGSPSAATSGSSTIETINPTSSVTLLTGTAMSTPSAVVTVTSSGSSSGASASSGGATGVSATTASSTSSKGTAPTLSAGKAAALLGALGGVVVFAL